MTSPVPTRQAPGFYRHRVGEAVVTAIHDGTAPIDLAAMLQNIDARDTRTLLRAAGRPASHRECVNAFLVQTPAYTVLIDTGVGQAWGPGAGHMMDNLAATGVAPADIDVVLLTHMHVDHVGALLDADGQPNFPNATLMPPQAEAAFWLDDARAAAAPEAAQATFALAKRVTASYGARLQPFAGAEPVPGIAAAPLPGHTPGHTGFVLGAGADRLLIWGDIVHVPDVQSGRPDAALPFDTDQPTAISTRRAVLARAADEDLVVAGMHMVFPAFARVVRVGDAYAIRPVAWQPEL